MTVATGGLGGSPPSPAAARAVPGPGVVSSAASPVLLIAGGTIAALLQPASFNPVADTVSALAALGAADRWVMTLVFVAVGLCDAITGAALRPAAPAGRLILIGGAVAGMLVAASPEHAGGGSVSHAVWASLGVAGLAAWPSGRPVGTTAEPPPHSAPSPSLFKGRDDHGSPACHPEPICEPECR